MKKLIIYTLFMLAVINSVYAKGGSLHNEVLYPVKDSSLIACLPLPSKGLADGVIYNSLSMLISSNGFLIDADNSYFSHTVHKPKVGFKGNWSGLDIGFTNFLSSHFSGALPPESQFMSINAGKSISVGLNVFQYNIGLDNSRNNFGIVTGMGINWNNFRFDSQNLLMRNDEGITSFQKSDYEVKKNKLTTTFLTVPLLFELQVPTSSSKTPFFVNAGLYAGFKLGSHTKVVYYDHPQKNKDKSRTNLNVNSFKYGFSARVGYRFIKIFANCDMSPLFHKGQGPELYPYSIGLSFKNF